jgi:hypothetical protein
MQDTSRDDIRRLLKTFGVKADEAIIAHLAQASGEGPLRLRVTLDDLTDYNGKPPAQKLHFTVEGEVRR